MSDGKYLNNTSKTDVTAGNSGSSIWTISITDGVALITNTSNGNRFLGDNGSNAYKAYSTSNNGLDTYPHNFTVYLVEEEVSGTANTITAIADQEVGVLKSITLTPTSYNGTTPFTFSTTSDKISLSTTSGTSCTVTGFAVTGETDAVVTIGQAAGTHEGTNYLSATPINVNVSVVDNRTTPGITFSTPEEMESGDEQTVTVTTTHTGTRSVTSSNEDIVYAEVNGSGNIDLLAGDLGGTATITLSIAENGDYKATSNTFTVTVDDGKSDPTITVNSNEVGINATKTFTLTSNSTGAITVTMDAAYDDYAVFDDNDNNGTFDLLGVAVGTVTVNISQSAAGDYRAYNTTFNIEVVDNRSVPSFSFSPTIKTVDWDDRGDFVAPTLTNESDATPSYSSSNTSVATVNSSTGIITFVAGGETTITATVSGSATYKDAEASYTLIVNKPYEFTETFNSASLSGTSVNNADNSGWTVSTAYVETPSTYSKAIRIASGSSAGYLNSPTLTDMPEYAVMTFKSMYYGSDDGATLTLSGTNCTVSPSSVTPGSTYSTYTVYIHKTADNPQLSFSAVKSKRIWIDDISITDLPNATITIGDVEVKEGATANATITSDNTTGAFTFVSSDESIATVAKVGEDYVVTGVAEGSATITATQAGNTYYKTTLTTFTVNVISATAVMNPTLSVADGSTVEIGNNITINVESGCTIKYTTDNTDPTVSGTATTIEANTANVVVPTGVNSLTLKAVAKNGENFSEVVTANYTVVKKTLSASFASDAIEVAIGADAAEPALTNPSGGTVTWESDDTDVVTVSADGQLTAIAAGTTTITASIATTDTYQAGTASYEVTVYDPMNVDISFNNTFFGIDAITSWSTGDPTTATGTYRNISVTYAKGTGSYYYCNASQIRCYDGNTLSFSAPSGYYLASITFSATAWNPATPTDGSMNKSNTKLWEGCSSTVSFSWGSNTKIESANVTLIPTTVSATISAAKYATFHSAYKLDFSETGITVYTAAHNKTTDNVTLTEVEDGLVPANTPVIIYKDVDEKTTIGVPVHGSDIATLSGNELLISDGTAEGDDVFVLANKSKGVGFYHWAGSSPLSVGRVYIELPALGGGAREFVSMIEESETTGIHSVENRQLTMENGNWYTLGGQKMNGKPATKGIYIINGKKVVVK